MQVRYDIGAIFAPIVRLFGGGQKSQPQYFNTGPSAADVRAQEERAAQEAKNKSMAEAANRQGAASSLLTAADSGSDFSGLKTRKTLLGGA
jgi:hypothetical protein